MVKKLKFKHYIKVEGEVREIDPRQTGIADQCKLLFKNITTGKEHKLIVGEKAGA